MKETAAVDSESEPSDERSSKKLIDRPLTLVGAGAAARLVATGLAAIIGLATTAIAVRLLGVSTYGEFAFSLSTMVLVSSLVRLGLEAGTTRSVASISTTGHTAELSSTVRSVYSLTFWSGIVGAVLTALFMLVIHRDLPFDTRVALSAGMALLLMGTNYVAATFSIARGFSRVAMAELPYLMLGFGKLLIVVSAVIIGTTDIGWLAIGYAAAGLVSAVMCVWLARAITNLPPPVLAWSLPAAVRIVPTFFPFAIAALATYTLSRLDVVVLGITAGSRAVGIYEPTLKVTQQLLILVPVLVGAQFLPVATRMVVAGTDVSLRRLFAKVTKLGYVIALPIVLLLAGFPDSVVSALYGRSFDLQSEIVWILMGGFVVNLIGGPNLPALMATGNRKALLTANLTALAAVVVLAIALIPPFGTRGAAIATSLSFVILNVLMTAAIWKVKRIHPYERSVIYTIASSIVPVAVIVALRSWIPDDSLLVGASVSFVVWVAWAAALLMAGLVRLPELARLPFLDDRKGL